MIDRAQPAIRASWVLAGSALIAVIHFQLLPALLAGLLAFELVHLAAPRLQRHFASQRAQLVVVVVLATAVVGAIALGVMGSIAFFKSDAGSLAHLLARMAQIIEDARSSLPPWIVDSLPATTDDTRGALAEWLREHAAELRTLGTEAGVTMARMLIGLIIGAMIATQEVGAGGTPGPLAVALIERARRLAEAFRRMVFAQLRISVVNTCLTALYLLVVLPLAGVSLPLTKTMIAIALVAGLLPVVGNLISNSVIVIVSLAHSLHAAIVSLVFLVVVHKLEYFLNARIVGKEIEARAWELLMAMLLMEAIFGLPGMVAAPIAYAWLKDELNAAGML